MLVDVSNPELTAELKAVSGWLPDSTEGFTLGHLLRKLEEFGVQLYQNAHRDRWYCGFDNYHENLMESGTTPENAAARFCCYLFRQNILKRDDGATE